MSKFRNPNMPEHQSAVVPDPVLFNERDHSGEQKLITDAVNALFNDNNLCDYFNSLSAVPLTQTDAVVVPAWRLPDKVDRDHMGVTDAGYVCSEDDRTMNPNALTIRERPLTPDCSRRLRTMAGKVKIIKTDDGTPQMTKDGTPRIALALNALGGTVDELKLILLHEFVHAHDIPGYRPPLNIVHDDLTYLPEYDELLDKAHLGGGKLLNDLLLWFFAALTALITTASLYQVAGWETPRILRSLAN